MHPDHSIKNEKKDADSFNTNRSLLNWIRSSLTVRLIVSGTLVVLAAGYLLHLVGTHFIERYTYQAYIDKGASIARALDADIRSIHEFRNQQELYTRIQKTLWLEPEVLSITVYERRGDILVAFLASQPDLLDSQANTSNQEALTQNTIVSRENLDNGETTLSIFTPVHVAKQEIGTFEIVLTLEGLQTLQRELLRSLAIVYFIVTGAALFVFAAYIRLRVVTPVVELADKVRNVAAGDLTAHVEETRRDEIGFLQRDFNLMTGNLNRQNRDILRAREQIEYQATHDLLTGLHNRFMFEERLNETIALCKRHNRKAVLVVLDLDQFKQVNDSVGHTGGDQLLIQVADQLRSRIREEDMLARLGGDEFVLIITEVSTDLAEALIQVNTVISDLFESISQPFSVQTFEYEITVSAGIANFPDQECEAVDVLKAADIALYKAKEEAGNSFRWFDNELQKVLEHRINILKNLQFALTDNQLRLHFQPQVDDQRYLFG
ncbi:MAG: diguanylate cyclase, partial [Pseudomonadota bacterium]